MIMPGVLIAFVLVFRVKTNTRTTLHLSAGMRGSVPSSSTSGKGNVAHGETSVPVANGDWIVLVCLLIVCRSHETSTIRSELDTTHRALRCIHDSREAPLSAVPAVPVTSLSPTPVEMSSSQASATQEVNLLNNQTNLSKHFSPDEFLLGHGLPSKALVTPLLAVIHEPWALK